MKSREILKEAEKIRARKKSAPPKEKTYHLITFSLAGKRYGLEIQFIKGIQWVGKVTRVPGLPDYILGLTSLKGDIVSVVDLCLLLGLRRRASPPEPSLIIVSFNEVTTSFLVDALGEVMEVSEGSIKPIPPKGKAGVEFIKGSALIDGIPLNVIDLESLMLSPKMRFE